MPLYDVFTAVPRPLTLLTMDNTLMQASAEAAREHMFAGCRLGRELGTGTCSFVGLCWHVDFGGLLGWRGGAALFARAASSTEAASENEADKFIATARVFTGRLLTCYNVKKSINILQVELFYQACFSMLKR